MPACAGLLELRGSELKLLKSTFNAKNFLTWFSWSIQKNFDAIYSWNVCCSPNSRRIH